MDSNTLQKKILIVEDDFYIADLYAHVLSKAGYLVKVVHSGDEALNLLNQEVFYVMLLDIMMPGKNGLEVLKEWRIKSLNSPMAVVFLSNLGQEDVIKQAFNLGAQGYFVKANITPEQIVDKVANPIGESNNFGLSPNANEEQKSFLGKLLSVLPK